MKAQYETQLKRRKTDENGDMIFGAGSAGFESDLSAMTQVLKTRLAAGEGEWWEGDAGALPYFSEILGRSATDKSRELIDLLIISRIMDTVGVISVSDVSSSIVNRQYRFSCKVQTTYGETKAEVTL